MKLTIFGATGRTGVPVVEQALAAGHHVTAVVRDRSRFSLAAHHRLTIIEADVMDPTAIEPAVAGADVVITAIGPRGSGATSVSEDSVGSIIQAMKESGARRLVTMSGSIVSDVGDGIFLGRIVKPLARRTFLRHVYIDMCNAEELVHRSDLRWTIVRPPRLTEKPASGKCRFQAERNVRSGTTISRADLATFLLDAARSDTMVHRHMFVAT